MHLPFFIFYFSYFICSGIYLAAASFLSAVERAQQNKSSVRSISFNGHLSALSCAFSLRMQNLHVYFACSIHRRGLDGIHMCAFFQVDQIILIPASVTLKFNNFKKYQIFFLLF